MSQPVLGVVADHQDVGFGHLGRTLAIAQGWCRDGGEVDYFLRQPVPDTWQRRIRDAGARLHPFDAIPNEPVDGWVVDGYRFEPAWYGELRSIAPVTVVDDFGASGSVDADLIVDQNLGATPGDYPDFDGDPGRLLLGPKYALLRGEVIASLPDAEPDRTPPPTTLLVSIGGEPTSALRSLVDSALDLLDEGLTIERLENVDDIGQVLRRVDLALSAAGSTCWDLCAFGIPAVIVAVASNQVPIAHNLDEAGAALDAGDLDSLTPNDLAEPLRVLRSDPDRRSRQASVGRAMVDGRGADRVVEAIGALLSSGPQGPARSRP